MLRWNNASYTHTATVEQQRIHSVPVQVDLCAMKKNDKQAALCEQQSLMSLPFPHTPVFDADPLQYKNFIWGFVLSVESKANKTDCLYLFIYSFILEQFMKGPSQRWWVVASTFPLKEATKWLKSFVRSNLEMNTELLQLTLTRPLLGCWWRQRMWKPFKLFLYLFEVATT